MSITSKSFGHLPSGEEVHLFTLTNANGLSAEITNYGGIVVSIHTPDRDGVLADVVLGRDNLEGYLAGTPYFGAICGRVAGRITNAQFTIGDKTYQLEDTDHGNTLHGGAEGLSFMLWDAEIINDAGTEKLRLSLTDPDGHNGFPGELKCSVTYSLLEDDSLQIEYQASCDQTTPLNLTNHSYFNLRGAGNVLEHSVQIFADSVATTGDKGVLLGRRDPVVSGYNDFQNPMRIGSLETLDGGNADIHYFLNKGRSEAPELAAVVKDPLSGRVLETLTTEPGVQFYAGLSLSDPEVGLDYGKGGIIHQPYDAFCLETQDYADSVNFPEMGNAVLQAGETFTSTTIYRFSVE